MNQSSQNRINIYSHNFEIESIFLIRDKYIRVLICWLLLVSTYTLSGQVLVNHSVARMWNEVLLEAIRNDFARPTVHARNLFHASIALYDSWAVLDKTASTYLLGKTIGTYSCPFDGIDILVDKKAASEQAMSYAAYHLLIHRFQFSPGADETLPLIRDLMAELDYDVTNTSVDYSDGDPAALGNYLCQCIIAFGLQDNSNEVLDYRNDFYTPVNPPMDPGSLGIQGISDPNRWQPLSFEFFIDQAGFQPSGKTPSFLSAEWGHVVPFALKSSDLTIYERDDHEYWVYHDPGNPTYLLYDSIQNSEGYRWGHSLVATWSSHLDPTDGIMWDISPATQGNLPDLPVHHTDYPKFYDFLDGGDPSQGRIINPRIGAPYTPQMVPRGDFVRVIAEYWADGPDSETPPGHWFTILNYVNDHPLLEKRFKGQGEILDDLEWDVKSYFLLAGAMHDAAVSAWGIKGFYDYVRPISAIRYMADQGQSTDKHLPNYAPPGLPLEEGFIELVQEGDSLAGENNEYVGKIKLYAWKGHHEISDPGVETAGVGWILAENWWPYQRATFVTPPFAGYVSGHSTFSRAAAEVMTLLTGDEYFPGGMGEFVAKKNEFLVFEEGPSMDVVLQWATYRDASDQTSLSRIWGGIHPPVDDIPGRLIGIKVGEDAFDLAEQYFGGEITTRQDNEAIEAPLMKIHPNPANGQFLNIILPDTGSNISVRMTDPTGKLIFENALRYTSELYIEISKIPSGLYMLTLTQGNKTESQKVVIINSN